MEVVDHQVPEVVPKETSQRSLGRREDAPKQEVNLVQCVIRLVVRVQESVVCCDGELSGSSGNEWKCGGGPE